MLDRQIILDESNYRKIKSVRTFYIKDNETNAGFEMYEGYIDEKLIEMKRNKKVDSSLIETISKKQFDIIKNETKKDIIVQGCAGSGKTAVLLHRLSNYIYNVPDEKKNYIIKHMKIISPSSYIKALYSDMAKILKLNEVEHLTIEEYYTRLIKKYNLEIDFKNNIIDEKSLNKIFLKFIYDLGKKYLVLDVKNYINQINYIKSNNIKIEKLSDIKETHSNLNNYIYNKMFKPSLIFSKASDEKLLKQVRNDAIRYIVNYNKKINQKEKDLNKIHKYLQELLGRLKKQKEENNIDFSIDEVKNKIKDINSFENELLEDFVNGKLKDKYTLEINFDKKHDIESDGKYEKIFEIIKNFNNKVVVDNKSFLLDEINKQDIKEIVNRISDEEDNIDNELLEIIDNIFKSEKKYNRDKQNISAAILAYIKTDSTFIANYIIELFLRTKYKQFSMIYDEHLYRHKLYLYLYLMYEIYGEKSEDTYINIDEAQDFSINELKLLKRILTDKCRFDIYGDLNQKLQDYRCVNQWNEINFVLNKNIYELDYSYRNTKQIVEYVNKKTNSNMKSLNLNGDEVKEFSQIENALIFFLNKKLLSESENNESINTFAIIVPVECKINEFKEEVKAKLSVEEFESFVFDSVDFDKISVIDVFTAKGLEFSNVLVYNKDNKFTNNQLYVSLTRATNTLIYCGK